MSETISAGQLVTSTVVADWHRASKIQTLNDLIHSAREAAAGVSDDKLHLPKKEVLRPCGKGDIQFGVVLSSGEVMRRGVCSIRMGEVDG